MIENVLVRIAIGVIVTAMMSLEAQASIVRPDPSEISEIGEFTPEWCSSNLGQNSPVDVVCVGRAASRWRSVRAVGVKHTDGRSEFYVELYPASVELLNPKFEIVGPVNGSAAQAAEIGKVEFFADANGETKAVRGFTSRLGSIFAQRGD